MCHPGGFCMPPVMCHNSTDDPACTTKLSPFLPWVSCNPSIDRCYRQDEAGSCGDQPMTYADPVTGTCQPLVVCPKDSEHGCPIGWTCGSPSSRYAADCIPPSGSTRAPITAVRTNSLAQN
jgi:hypothetical protein